VREPGGGAVWCGGAVGSSGAVWSSRGVWSGGAAAHRVRGKREQLRPSLVCVDLCMDASRAVEQALVAALRLPGGPDATDAHRREFATRTMGWSAIDALRRWFGDEDAASCAHTVFEMVLEELVSAGWCPVPPGAVEAVDAVRAAGVPTAVLTVLPPAIRDRVVASVGWQAPGDVLLSPGQAGRGRPFPDLVWAAMRSTAVPDAGSVAVVGSTVTEMTAGRRAGAGVRIGICPETGPAALLRLAGATMVCGSLADVPGALDLATPERHGTGVER